MNTAADQSPTDANNSGANNKAPDSRIAMFVCLVVFLDAMGVGIVLPIMPQLIGELSGETVADAAKIGGYLVFIYAGMQFFSAPILGGISDQFGRRPILLLALLGLSIDYFMMAFAPSLALLFVARFIAGILGATYTAANAAIVDISTPVTRAKFFGLSGAASGIGLIFGPLLGGMLGELGTRLPFLAAGGLSLITFAYGMLAFPETLKPENRRAFSLRRANPLGSLIAIARSTHAGPVILCILTGLFFIYLANQSYVSIWSYFVTEAVGWTPFTIGISIAVYGFSQAFVQGVLTGPLVSRVGEVRAAIFSMCIGILTYCGLGFVSLTAHPGPTIYGLIIFGAMSGFAFPAMQALMTKNTPDDAQGELQGANSSAFSITAIIGPLLMSQTFSSFSDDKGTYLPGAAFLVSAILVVTALFIFRTAVTRLRTRHAAPDQ